MPRKVKLIGNGPLHLSKKLELLQSWTTMYIIKLDEANRMVVRKTSTEDLTHNLALETIFLKF